MWSDASFLGCVANFLSRFFRRALQQRTLLNAANSSMDVASSSRADVNVSNIVSPSSLKSSSSSRSPSPSPTWECKPEVALRQEGGEHVALRSATRQRLKKRFREDRKESRRSALEERWQKKHFKERGRERLGATSAHTFQLWKLSTMWELHFGAMPWSTPVTGRDALSRWVGRLPWPRLRTPVRTPLQFRRRRSCYFLKQSLPSNAPSVQVPQLRSTNHAPVTPPCRLFSAAIAFSTPSVSALQQITDADWEDFCEAANMRPEQGSASSDGLCTTAWPPWSNLLSCRLHQ